jgi:hypothetical protein
LNVRLPPTSRSILAFYLVYQPREQWVRHFVSTTSSIKASTKDEAVKADISTLHPELLQETDYLDLSSKSVLAAWNRETQKLLGYRRAMMTYSPRNPQPFPPGSRGFLYYTAPPGLPPTAGEIRFRITPSSSPTSFHQGSDLLGPFGMPWRVQVFSRASSSSWGTLFESLLRDGQITLSVFSDMQAIIGPSKRTTPINCLFSLEQPFPHEFSTWMDGFSVVARGKLTRFITSGLLCEDGG